MKTNQFLTCALAAMAFTACSNDDAPGIDNGGAQGALVESITVQFVENNGANTRADLPTQPGVDTENNIYHAFIFAKEAAPGHANPVEGDWTVKEVGALDAIEAIKKGDLATSGTMDNMVTFKGVTQGSAVYVIANDPKLTLAAAEDMAHKGMNSEAKIKEYAPKLDKSYLNSLVLKGVQKPTKQFVMAGMATISSDPVEKGKSLIVPVKLNREMAKVNFSAWVTTDEAKKAFGKVEIKPIQDAAWGESDGLIVVRIPRKVSFFAAQENAWYYPLVGDATTMDWGMKDGKEWNAFAGDVNSDPATIATEAGKEFNNLSSNTAASAAEYRYTWKIAAADDGGYANYVSGTKKVNSPTFYVSPNYTTVKDNATLVLVQATYTGNTTIDPIFTAEIMTELDIVNLGAWWDTPANLDDLLAKLKAYNKTDAKTLEAQAKYKDVTDATKLVDYKKYQKLFYKASISEIGKTATERNFQYKVDGVITTLGAKSIPDAIVTESIDMIVTVTVNPWTLVANEQEM